MGFSDDWADTVRASRLARWEKRGGPHPVERWHLENPKRAIGVALALSVLLGVGLWMVFGRSFVGLITIAFLFTYYQMLRGEQLIYDEWLERHEPERDAGPAS